MAVAGHISKARDVSIEGQGSDQGVQKGDRRPEGLTELMVFYCERAAGFCRDVGHTDPAYFGATLVRTFGQALDATTILVPNVQSQFLSRLDQVGSIGRQLGYGVGDDIDVLLAELGSSFELEVPHGERNRRRKN